MIPSYLELGPSQVPPELKSGAKYHPIYQSAQNSTPSYTWVGNGFGLKYEIN